MGQAKATINGNEMRVRTAHLPSQLPRVKASNLASRHTACSIHPKEVLLSRWQNATASTAHIDGGQGSVVVVVVVVVGVVVVGSGVVVELVVVLKAAVAFAAVVPF